MDCLPRGWPLIVGDLARLHELLEAPQILADHLRRLMAEQPGDGRADLAGRRVVLQAHVHLGASSTEGGLEAHRSGADDVRALERPPGDQLAGNLVDDLGVPLDGAPPGAFATQCERRSSICLTDTR